VTLLFANDFHGLVCYGLDMVCPPKGKGSIAEGLVSSIEMLKSGGTFTRYSQVEGD
jgi:hypothetical protein